MNTKFTALTLAAATAFAFTPKPAVAGDKEAALVGGLLGGLIIGAALADHADARTVVVHDRCATPVIVRDRCDDGYWKVVETRVWVPGTWVIERGHHGRTYRRYIEGHYECRTERVWVAYDRHSRHERREIGRGYGRDPYDRYDRDLRR
jgi:hypothetical protein